ncbi:CAAX amino terminal protease self- immunity [compost metagenome]
MKKQNIRKLIIFIIITLASGWIGVAIDTVLTEQPEGNSLGMGLWLILPFLTGIILRIVYRDWKNIGLKLNIRDNKKWYILSIGIYLLVTAITIGLAKIFNLIEVSNLAKGSFLSLAIASATGGLLKNVFEEFAWRGYLTPKLIELKLNDWYIYGISGLVWALWHVPYYLVFLPDIYFQSISRGNMILIGCILMVCWTIMYVEIYRITKSVWPCVLMHTVEDAVPNVMVMTGGFVSLTKMGDILLNPITGVIATAIFITTGLLLRRFRMMKYE